MHIHSSYDFKSKLAKSSRYQFLVLGIISYLVSACLIFFFMERFFSSYLLGLANGQSYAFAVQEWRQIANGILSGWNFLPGIQSICIANASEVLFRTGPCPLYQTVMEALLGGQIVIPFSSVEVGVILNASLWGWALFLPVVGAAFTGLVFQLFKGPITKTMQIDLFNFLESFDQNQENLTKFQIDLKNQAEQIISLREQAALSTMVAQVAHDLQSPLSAMKIGVAKIQEPELKNICGLAMVRIQETLSKLLERYRSSAARSTVDTHEDLHKFDLVEQSHNTVREKQLTTEAKIEFSNSCAQPALVMANGNGWSHLLSNLLNNALEANTGSKPVLVNITRVDEFYRVEVKDSGKGISSEHLETLLTAPRSMGKTSMHNAGFGLGLKGAHGELKRWNCTMNMRSEVGAGTRVIVLFPALN